MTLDVLQCDIVCRALHYVPKVVTLLAPVGKTREGHEYLAHEYLAMINHENTTHLFLCCSSDTNLHQHCSRLTFSLPFAVSTLKIIRFRLQLKVLMLFETIIAEICILYYHANFCINKRVEKSGVLLKTSIITFFR